MVEVCAWLVLGALGGRVFKGRGAVGMRAWSVLVVRGGRAWDDWDVCLAGAWAFDASGVVCVGILAEFMSHHEHFEPFACLRIKDGLSDNF